MKWLIDWLLAIACIVLMMAAYADVQRNDEQAEARRAREAAQEMKLLIRGME